MSRSASHRHEKIAIFANLRNLISPIINTEHLIMNSIDEESSLRCQSQNSTMNVWKEAVITECWNARIQEFFGKNASVLARALRANETLKFCVLIGRAPIIIRAVMQYVSGVRPGNVFWSLTK